MALAGAADNRKSLKKGRSHVNWFKFAQFLISTGIGAVGLFVKNEKSQKTAAALISIASVIVEGLANQNPDGTPAEAPYTPVETPK